MAPEDQGPSLSEGHNQGQCESWLVALPSEVIHRICAQLCPHCRGLTPMHVITGSDKASPLKALSETCTALRDVAQPLLYHVPYILRYPPFLRTIRERSDLADSVKCLIPRVLNHGRLREDFNDFGFALVKEMAAELQMITSQDVPFEDEFSEMLAFLAGQYKGEREEYADPAHLQMEHFHALLDTILIASLPHLEILAIHGWQDYEYYPSDVLYHAKRRLARAGRLVSDRCAGTTMPSLHTIVMNGWGSNDRWSETHDNVHLQPYEYLFSCASSLTQLVFDGCLAPCTWPEASIATNSSIWPTLPALKSVVFDEMDWGSYKPWEASEHAMMYSRWMTDEDEDTAYVRLRQMATQCRRLRSCKISINCSDGMQTYNLFSPSRLVQSLQPTAERLETLMVHIEAIVPRADPAVLIGAEIHSFTKLKELSLDEMCFCHHWHHGGADNSNSTEGASNNTCLVDVLPPSVSFLNIRLRKKPRVIPDLVYLGIAASAGKFPGLKHVTVEAYITVREDSPDSLFGGSDYVGYSSESPDQSSRIKALRPKLTAAFGESTVAVEVIGMRMRHQRGTSVRPALF